MGLGGLFKSACLTSSARRAAPLAAVCKPGTPLDSSIYGDHTSHSGLHLPWTRRRPPSPPFYSTLPVGHFDSGGGSVAGIRLNALTHSTTGAPAELITALGKAGH